MLLHRFFQVVPLNWEVLPELSARLTRHGIQITHTRVSVSRYPTSMEFDSWPPALAYVKQYGLPRRYEVRLTGQYSDKKGFRLSLRQYLDDVDSEHYLALQLDEVTDESIMNDLTAFLGLTPDVQVNGPPTPKRTAFIAHRFDQHSEQLADRLARFLSLLDFEVKTGRSFSPKPVATKVKERVDSQAVVFVLLTPGDSTWLTQESMVGYAAGKPLFVLVERSVDFKSGMLADLEYIPFTLPHIDNTFVPILEGLRDLGYRVSPAKKRAPSGTGEGAI